MLQPVGTGGTLEGYVTTSAGDPVVGAQVSTNNESVTTDANGHYGPIAASGGMFSFHVGISEIVGTNGHTNWNYSEEISITGAVTRDVVFPAVAVTGTVRNESNLPIAGAGVGVGAFTSDPTYPFQSDGYRTTGADGRYAMVLLEPSEEGALIDVVPPEGSDYLSMRFVGEPLTGSDRDFTLTEGFEVSGQVRTAAGAPVPQAFVSVGNDTGSFGGQADANGLYRFQALPGSYISSFSSSGIDQPGLPLSFSGNPPGTLLVSGNVSHDVTLPPISRIHGRVVDSLGVPVPGIEVFTALVRNAPRPRSTDRTTTDANGEYELFMFNIPTSRLAWEPSELSGFSLFELRNFVVTGDLQQHVVLQLPDTQAPVITSGPVVTVSDDTATVSWTTNEPSDSTVEYGIDGLDLTRTVTARVTSHNVTLTGLMPATEYRFRVISRDAAGNSSLPAEALASDVTVLAAPAEVLFRTMPVPGDVSAPVFTSGPTVSFRDRTSAVIVWETDEPASALLEYGTSAALGSSLSGGADNFARRHALRLVGLSPGTSYSFRVTARDPDGNGPTRSVVASFSTTTAPDTQAPTISALTARALDDSRLLVTWTTDEPATSGVSYNDGTTFNLSNDETPVRDHAVVLAGLTAATSYTIRASSIDPAGNGPAVSAPVVAATAAAEDTRAPVLTGARAEDITRSTAVITWSTDEQATSAVSFGPSATAMHGRLADATLRGAHRLLLTGLVPGQTYFVQPNSSDASGNTGTAPRFSFRTLADGVQISIADASVVEGNSGTRNVDLRVTLSRSSTTTVRVRYATANGTAGSSDYNPASGQLRFRPGRPAPTSGWWSAATPCSRPTKPCW